MCGIAVAIRTTERPDVGAGEAARRVWQTQRHRGSQGFGMAVVAADLSVSVHRYLTPEDALVGVRLDVPKDALAVLFHHRYPTSSPNEIDQTHPFEVRRGNKAYLSVHNGHVSNAEELKKAHEKRGFKYSSESTQAKAYQYRLGFNDSEALAHELALVLDGAQEKVGFKGAAAFVTLECDVKDGKLFARKLHFGTNGGNPLKYGFSGKGMQGVMVVSSETGATELGKGKYMYVELVKTGIGSLRMGELAGLAEKEEPKTPTFDTKPKTAVEDKRLTTVVEPVEEEEEVTYYDVTEAENDDIDTRCESLTSDIESFCEDLKMNYTSDREELKKKRQELVKAIGTELAELANEAADRAEEAERAEARIQEAEDRKKKQDEASDEWRKSMTAPGKIDAAIAEARRLGDGKAPGTVTILPAATEDDEAMLDKEIEASLPASPKEAAENLKARMRDLVDSPYRELSFKDKIRLFYWLDNKTGGEMSAKEQEKWSRLMEEGVHACSSDDFNRFN